MIFYTFVIAHLLSLMSYPHTNRSQMCSMSISDHALLKTGLSPIYRG